jgi:hypothetical protein
VKKKPKRVRLTAAQSRSWIQFNYYSFENPKLTFEQVASARPQSVPAHATGKKIRAGMPQGF